MCNLPRFMTIREVARTGILSEHRLRMMEKSGELPGVRAGVKFLVNYGVLLEQLDAMSREAVKADA